MDRSPKCAGIKLMSNATDVALARDLIKETGGDCWDGKSDMLGRVEATMRRYAKKHDRKPMFTARRLRAFFHREAAGVRFWEMIELAHIRDFAREEKEILADAKSEYAALLDRIGATANPMAAQGSSHRRAGVDALGEFARGSRPGSQEPRRHFDQGGRQGQTDRVGDRR